MPFGDGRAQRRDTGPPEGRAGIRAIIGLWRGEVPLGRAFWLWGVLGGGVVALFATILALALLTGGAQTGS